MTGRPAFVLGEAPFAAPEYLAPSAWTEHVPFAFWIVEALRPAVLVELGTHHGTSYFAFCQALRRLGPGRRAWAVDTWQGDDHAGFYGEEVWQAVEAHNRATYADFSTLRRETFAEAAPRFADGSIDLLHIDGLHSVEAVTEDFETWAPKLTRRGVVLLHDTREYDRGFGVWQLVEALRPRFPLFDFAHGHGLGVVGVGPEPPPAVAALLAAEQDPEAKAAIERCFARLGRSCAALRPPREPAPGVVAAIAASPLFDAARYAAQVPGLAAAEAARHYARFGPRLGLDPGPGFDAAWYLAAHPDVAAAGVNPLAHYLLHGRREGRSVRPRA